MRIVRDNGAALEGKFAAVAIGNFDGMHRGHHQVIHAVIETARKAGVAPAVLTFAPHPRRFFNPNIPVLSIEPMVVRMRRLKALGIESLIVRRFDAQIASMLAQDFIEKELCGRLHVQHVVTGENFMFGHKRSGDRNTLAKGAEQHHFQYQAVPSVMVGEEVCASTLIRGALAEGDVARAARYLGRPYEIAGRIQHGDKRGRELGFPTANIALPRIFLPALGVYAVRCVLVPAYHADISDIGLQWMKGVANIGMRPTFDGAISPRLEVHCFEAMGDVYGHTLRVQLVHFLRQEQRFEDVSALKNQINIDCERAREWFKY
jgi:riboflavin kinase/FMN adenylyltransferase